MRPLSLYRPGNIKQWSDYVSSVALTTSAQAFDTPAGAGFIQFSSTTPFTVKFGSTAAAIATTSSTGGADSELIYPGQDAIRALGSTTSCTGFSILASTAGGMVSVAYYGKGG